MKKYTASVSGMAVINDGKFFVGSADVFEIIRALMDKLCEDDREVFPASLTISISDVTRDLEIIRDN